MRRQRPSGRGGQAEMVLDLMPDEEGLTAK
jgi:hypothetical protein